MKKDDLLIVDIGRSFLFSSRLEFIPEKGYLPKINKFGRYPLFEEIDEVSSMFLSESSDAERYFLVEDGDSLRKLKGNVSKKNLKFYKRHLASLEKELDIEGLAVINLEKGIISKIDSQYEKFREIDFLDLELFKDNLKILSEIDITTEDLINFFLSDHPLPQQVSDHHKSFILSYIIGTIIASSFNFENNKYVIVLSEWFKSGFLDRSGFIYGFGKVSKVENYSFDLTGIWKLLLNEGKDEFSDMQFLNKKLFYPEFYTVQSEEEGQIRYVDSNDKVIDYRIKKEEQQYIQHYEDGPFSSQLSNTGGDIFLNIDSLKIRDIKKVDDFKTWYKFYKYNQGDYVQLSFEDKYNHIVEVESDFDNELMLFKEKDIHFHDFSDMGKIQQGEVVVMEGQKIEANDILVEKTYLGGTFSKRIRSRVSGVIEKIDMNTRVIEIKSEEHLNYLKNFDYEVLERTSKNKVRIKIMGFRVNASFFTQDYSSFGFINRFSEKTSFDKYSIVWFEGVSEFKSMLSKAEIGNFPRTVILPGIKYSEFVELANKYSKAFSFFQLVILNGFGDRDYTSKQLRLLKTCDQKNMLVDPTENSLYILEKKTKFDSSFPPVTFHKFSNIYTFDDWNLTGEIIYNDEDSTIFRSFGSLVIDIAEFNLIEFNK